jgi:ubiquinone/menaquinone biosynthesis C-methylase UbiE
MNAMELSFADATFDLAYCFSTLLLVREVERAVGEIGRVLRPEASRCWTSRAA